MKCQKIAKLTKHKRLGGWVFNRWGSKCQELKSIMINSTQKEAMKHLRKQGFIIRKN